MYNNNKVLKFIYKYIYINEYIIETIFIKYM